jgi:hypothetical protein
MSWTKIRRDQNIGKSCASVLVQNIPGHVSKTFPKGSVCTFHRRRRASRL